MVILRDKEFSLSHFLDAYDPFAEPANQSRSMAEWILRCYPHECNFVAIHSTLGDSI